MKINKEWHTKNRMPQDPTMAQRVAWHKDHLENCACRPMPESVKKFINTK